MTTITVKCIANSYNNAGLSLSKGQVEEVEDNAIVRNAIKTGYLQEIIIQKATTDLKKEDVKAKTEDLKLEEPKATTSKKAPSK